MVTHVVAWNLKEELSEEEKIMRKADMKKNLEALCGKVPGLLTATFIDSPLPGSNREVALVTTHEKAEDIAAYSVHPEHVKTADTFVRPFTRDRACINFG